MSQDYKFCLQRKLAQTNNIPLGRVTPVNPYETKNLTKFQLDMRRKVEILKYSANKSSSQTNKMTKKEAFALLVKGGLSRTQSVLQSNQVECGTDQLIPTPTTSCDVPGPVMYLYEDTAVPLYNYSDFNTRTYPDFVPTDSTLWQFVVKSNSIIYDAPSATTTIYYLIINKNIDKKRYTFKIVTPVALTIEGSVPPSYIQPSGFITVQILSVKLSIYYNDSKVVVVQAPVSGFQINIGNFRVSSTVSNFSATHFLGNLQFENIQLYTEPTYVYKIDISADLSVSSTSITSNVALILNPDNVINDVSGCSILNPSFAVNGGASISGV